MYLSTKWLLMFIPPPGAYELTCHPSFKRIISILAATMKISSAWGIKSKFEIFSLLPKTQEKIHYPSWWLVKLTGRIYTTLFLLLVAYMMMVWEDWKTLGRSSHTALPFSLFLLFYSMFSAHTHRGHSYCVFLYFWKWYYYFLKISSVIAN